MNWMERNVVDRKNHRLILSARGRVFSVALEREVVPWRGISAREENGSEKCIRGIFVINISILDDQIPCLGRCRRKSHWIATRPSIVPMANPFDEGKQETTRVCHLSGETIV